MNPDDAAWVVDTVSLLIGPEFDPELAVFMGDSLSEGQDFLFQRVACYLTWAALKGLASAQVRLGGMHEYGNGVEQDHVLAMMWSRAAAEQDNVYGQYSLGDMYEHGKGVEADQAEAVKWYRAAAEQDHVDSLRQLGIIYADGGGVQRDSPKAIASLTKAAEHGDHISLYLLAGIHTKGKGVPGNLIKGARWYLKFMKRNTAEVGGWLWLLMNVIHQVSKAHVDYP